MKVRSYFRYKGLPHEWILRSPANQAEFQKYAKLPLVPLVVTPGGRGHPGFDADHRALRGAPQPSLQPDDPTLAFISALLEEYGDEWGNKWMFHYRWTYPADCWATAERIARQMMGAQGTLAVAQARGAVAERMSGRLGFVGSNPTTAAADRGLVQARAGDPRRASARRGRTCWAAGRRWPTSACGASSTRRRPIRRPARIMRASAPNVMAWVQRMLSPKDEGAFESWAALSAGLMPLLKEEVGRLFLPWSTANAEAIAEGREELRDDARPARPGRRSRRSTTPARCRRSAASTPPPKARRARRDP